MSNNTILYALCRLDYRDRMAGQGFRGLASTVMNENGFDEAHVELQPARMKRKKVAAAYNQAKYLKQRTNMMQWWADSAAHCCIFASDPSKGPLSELDGAKKFFAWISA